MSDEKKGGGEEGGGGGGYTDVFFWLLFVSVLWIVAKYFLDLFGFNFSSFPSLTSLFASLFDVVQVISVFLCLLFLVATIYLNFKLGELSHHGHHGEHGGHGGHGHGEHNSAHSHHQANSHTMTKPGSVSSPVKNRWQNIIKRSQSSSESDWRLAIIECDILLDEMLKKMGYHGESIADKLKLVERSDFHTIDFAWEAHKVRNRIAHSGSDFHLSYSEFERVFGLYKKVFEEFYFIQKMVSNFLLII
jgi:hypothetical protein